MKRQIAPVYNPHKNVFSITSFILTDDMRSFVYVDGMAYTSNTRFTCINFIQNTLTLESPKRLRIFVHKATRIFGQVSNDQILDAICTLRGTRSDVVLPNKFIWHVSRVRNFLTVSKGLIQPLSILDRMVNPLVGRNSHLPVFPQVRIHWQVEIRQLLFHTVA